MSFKEEREEQKQAILDGIIEDESFRVIAEKIGVRRWEVIRDIKMMRKTKDPELLKAQRIALEKRDEKKKTDANRFDETFFESTGLTLKEKMFQNMVYFYRKEIRTILNTKNQEEAIRKLPMSVRKTLVKNDILTKRGAKISDNVLRYLS